MQFLNPTLLCDFYKLSHRQMYPPKTQVIYSTWTPRGARILGVDSVVAFGAQMALQKLDEIFFEGFFEQDVDDVVGTYEHVVRWTLGIDNPPSQHLRDLHRLGYLPISVKALPEGVVTPLRVPHLTIRNTHPDFFWLTNYLETLLSCSLWLPSTSATIAFHFRRLLDAAAKRTGGEMSVVNFQGHDFSMRGMSSLESSVASGLGHLLSFWGTDTIPAIEAARHYYDADFTHGNIIGTSIPATEHSVQCAYGDDMAYFKRMISDVHPTGFVSIVADGYDFWDVITRVLPELKDDIMARPGRVVIRPDSGNPYDIVCGDLNFEDAGTPQYKGAIECLWEIFGGEVNEAGFKVLHPSIGLIYGDAITYERARDITDGLAEKGFASTNIVFGVGSYTYQYRTRDSLGWAMKSTHAVIDGKELAIFKDPKTDDGTKRSQKGRVVVHHVGDEYFYTDGHCLYDEVRGDQLREIYRDGTFIVRDSFENIRLRLEEFRER